MENLPFHRYYVMRQWQRIRYHRRGQESLAKAFNASTNYIALAALSVAPTNVGGNVLIAHRNI